MQKLSKERLQFQTKLENIAFLLSSHKFGEQARLLLQGKSLEEVLGEGWVEREVLRRFCALAEWHAKQVAQGKRVERSKKVSTLTALVAVQVLENALRGIYESQKKK